MATKRFHDILTRLPQCAAWLAGDQRGAVSVLVAAGLVAFFGFAAISIDAGRAFVEKQRLQNVADAASLAGARALPDQAEAERVAREVVAQNGIPDGDRVDVTFPDGGSIRVAVRNPVEYVFAPVLGYNRSTLEAAARAASGGVSSITGDDDAGEDQVNGGAVPLAVEWGNFQPGELVTLKVGPGGQTNGNFHALALGGQGASTYRRNLKYGFAGTVRVGDWLRTEPGNMAGPTRDGVTWRIDQDPSSTFDTVAAGSPRVAYVAVVDSFRSVQGRDEVKVAGFAAFYLERYAGNGEVTGRFLRWMSEGEIGGSDYGLRSTRLVE